jgi:hypothetical protein
VQQSAVFSFWVPGEYACDEIEQLGYNKVDCLQPKHLLLMHWLLLLLLLLLHDVLVLCCQHWADCSQGSR